jgi:hypothetical protein
MKTAKIQQVGLDELINEIATLQLGIKNLEAQNIEENHNK